MDQSQLPEPMRARRAERDARTPLQKVQDLLRGFVLDTDGLDQTRAEMVDAAGYTTRYLRQQLEALEWALEADLPPGTLLHLVESDANIGLDDDPTDAGAAVFLRQVADILRGVLAEAG
ncbi:hypothetical protein OWR29_27910 [Actinoplanes sp. Pm04-4]|uniref:Uncharacterized protein n=1 Tax=Paractinoplanes pyxinae TaxID=2997416 RepID=A0ABT4B8B3_9ACTN|nr:hypothetical protein [Actinoplanes pyxinae]MCY1141840.1 hypothetical protein [Actinoplanes pyxinae]